MPNRTWQIGIMLMLQNRINENDQNDLNGLNYQSAEINQQTQKYRTEHNDQPDLNDATDQAYHNGTRRPRN